MIIDGHKDGDIFMISVKGRLDTLTSPDLDKYMADADLGGIKGLVLDFKELDYISSFGIRTLMKMNKESKAKNISMKVVNVNSTVMEVLTMTGVDKFIELSGQ